MYSFRQIREALENASPVETDVPQQLEKLTSTSHLQGLVKDILSEAKEILASPPPALPFSLYQLFETQGSRLEFEQPYFQRRARIAILALAVLLDPTREYLPALENEIWEICLEYSWALPAHLPVGLAETRNARVAPAQTVDLFAAETAHQLAEILVWLKPRLNPWIEYRIRQEIERRVFHPLFYDPHHFWWESTMMNWAAVCGGAVGIAALALETDRERLAGMIGRVLTAMESFLEGFGEDGGCPEGINYWTYGFGYFVYFAEALRDCTRGKLDLLNSEKIKKIASFPNSVSLGKSSWVNYSDAPAKLQLETGLVSRLAERLGVEVPELEKIPLLKQTNDHPRFRWVHLTRNLLWTKPDLLHRPTPPGTFYLPVIQWVVNRDYFGSTMVGFSAKGGHNDEPHNHNDLGHFLLFMGEESLLCDLGAALYTRDYFREKRYSYLQASSLGHSVPVINGQAQQAGAKNIAKVIQYEETGNKLVFELDLTEAYPTSANLSRFTRKFEWGRQPEANQAQLELNDNFVFSTESNAVDEVFISLFKPIITQDTISWPGKQGRVILPYRRELFEAEIESLEAYAHEGQAIEVFRLRLHSKAMGKENSFRLLFTCEIKTGSYS